MKSILRKNRAFIYNQFKLYNGNIHSKIWNAQCKLYGFGCKKNEIEGLKELLKLKHYKEAYYPIAYYYYQNHNYKLASTYFYKLKDQHYLAQYYLALILLRNQNLEKAFYYLKLAASNNHTLSQFLLAVYYQSKKSIELSKYWYQKSIHFSFSQLFYGNLLIDAEGLNWIYKSAEQNNPFAYFKLGILYHHGLYVRKNLSTSVEYFQKVVQTNNVFIKLNTIAHYFTGLAYFKLSSIDLAIQHLKKAGDFVPAKRLLGFIYLKSNSLQAKKYLSFAASHRDIRSLFALIKHYRHSPSTINAIIKHYEQIAPNSIIAQVYLAELYQFIGDFNLAFKWFQIASENNTTPPIDILDYNTHIAHTSQRYMAKLMVARYYYLGYGVQSNPLLAFNIFCSLSKLGYSDAHYWLANCYEQGIYSSSQECLVQPNVSLAFEIYLKSANEGDMDGEYKVAHMLSNGIGTQKDLDAAFSWYTKAAKKGHTAAQFNLGFYYEHITQDVQNAIVWYQLAVENHSPLAMVRLAKLISNHTKSIHWLNKAIDMGNIDALRELATIYIRMENYPLAFDYYKKAADKNDALAWFALAKFYQGDYHLEQDLQQAMECLKKSNDLGHAWAMIDLANLYYRQGKIQDAMEIYSSIAEPQQKYKAKMIKRAKIEAATIIIYENYGNQQDKTKVYLWLKEMVTQVDIDGLSNIYELLGYCSENGIGTVKDRELAIQFYMDCIHQQDSTIESWSKQRSLFRLIYYYMEIKDYLSAYNHLKQLGPNFETLSQLKSTDVKWHLRSMKYFLGYLLLHGFGTEKIESEGIFWLSKAAEEGDGNALYELGQYHSQEESKSKDYYGQGVSVGHAGCMRKLALMLLEEEADQAILDEDYDGGAEILDLLENASKLGDLEATYQLGLAFENGLGDVIPIKDIDKAYEFYLIAADNHYELGIMKAAEISSHFFGKHEQSMELFHKADLLYGNFKAKIMLISYQFQGLYLEQDYRPDSERNDFYNFKQLKTIVDAYAATTSDKPGLGLAYYILGQCYELGRGTISDLEAAKNYYLQSISTSEHVDAMWRLGIVYKEKENNDIPALQWFRRAAEIAKHGESYYQLGLYHLYGLGGLEKNFTAAKKHFSKAVEQGHPMAMFELGQIIWNMDADYFYGYELYKTAGEQFHVASALRELGHLSHTGFSSELSVVVQQNYKSAFAYYCQAAQSGDPIAALMIGIYFEEGYLKEDLGQNNERALQWYESAYRLNCGGLSELAIGKLKHAMADTLLDPRQAEDIREEAFAWFESAANHLNHQSSTAKIMVALYYLNGWGRKSRDTEVGFHMLSEIADSGNDEAFIPIAQCYEEGIGTTYDMDKAFDFWVKAADLESPDALFRIGEIYDLGLNGVTDKDLASTYYTRANLAKSKRMQSNYHYHRVHSNRDSEYSIDSFISSSSSSSSISSQ